MGYTVQNFHMYKVSSKQNERWATQAQPTEPLVYFNNISAISWRLVLLMEETEVPGENHQLVGSHWQTLSHNVVSSTPRLGRIRTHKSQIVFGTDIISVIIFKSSKIRSSPFSFLLCWLLTHTQFNDWSSSMVLNFNKGNAKRGVSPRLKIWPGDLDLWPPSPWKSIGFQILLRTKYVPSLVKTDWRMSILECSQGCYGRTDGSVTFSLRNFVGEGIIIFRWNSVWLLGNNTNWKRLGWPPEIMCGAQI